MKTGTFRQPEKVTMLHLCMLLFLGCFFLGVFIANISWRDEALWTGFLYENQVRQFTRGGSVDFTVKTNLILQRGIPWLLLEIMQYFSFGILACAGWSGWLGLSGGFVFTCFLSRFGFAGIWQSAVTGFPQILVYAVAYVMFFVLTDAGRKLRWEWRNSYSMQKTHSRNGRFLYLILIFVNTAIYVTGIWLECYVNPWILQHGSVIK